MLAPERHQQILAILEERGSVRTIDLAQELQVTDETIRRDLQVLAESQQLTRVHGGASCARIRPDVQSFTERRALRVEQKKAMAQAALQLIQPGQTCAFDSSTTAFEVVCGLPNQSLRVLTNAYAVIEHVIQLDAVDLISTGGRYHAKTRTFVGRTYPALQRHNINTAFISCNGLDPRQGASEGYEELAIFKEILIQVAESVVLLVDSSKFHHRSKYFFAALNNLSTIITDNEADATFVAGLREQGCEVIIAP